MYWFLQKIHVGRLVQKSVTQSSGFTQLRKTSVFNIKISAHPTLSSLGGNTQRRGEGLIRIMIASLYVYRGRGCLLEMDFLASGKEGILHVTQYTPSHFNRRAGNVTGQVFNLDPQELDWTGAGDVTADTFC